MILLLKLCLLLFLFTHYAEKNDNDKFPCLLFSFFPQLPQILSYNFLFFSSAFFCDPIFLRCLHSEPAARFLGHFN